MRWEVMLWITSSYWCLCRSCPLLIVLLLSLLLSTEGTITKSTAFRYRPNCIGIRRCPLPLLSSSVSHVVAASHPSQERMFALEQNVDNDAMADPVTTATTTSTNTNITISLPRFFRNEVEEGTPYPSKLHYIHIQSILSDVEAATCLTLAQAHAQVTGAWDQPDVERHSTYATCDFAIETCSALDEYLHHIGFHKRIWQALEALYDIDQDGLSYLDLFCANYHAATTTTGTNKETSTMDRLEAHRDGSILSFSLLLTPPELFEGGGTFYDALRDVAVVNDVDSDDSTGPSSVLHQGGVIRPTRAGDVVFHSGKILHGADVVTSGQRTVMVGFVDVADWCQRPKVLATACRNFGRMDVATIRFKRQLERINKVNKKGASTTSSSMASTSSSSSSLSSYANGRGWILNNARWLPDTQGRRGRSHIRGWAPIFPTTANRAHVEFQRLQKLQAEDVLLRTILLLPDEKEESFQRLHEDDNSITIL